MKKRWDEAQDSWSTADIAATNDYTFDELDRFVRVDQYAAGGNAVAEKRVGFAYNAPGQFSTISRYANLAGTQLVIASSYSYDSVNRLTGLTHAKGLVTLADYDWTFDDAGRVTQFVSLTDGTADYTHDVTDQLTGADYNYQTDEAYSYDSSGNRTNTGYVTGTGNRLMSDGTYNYAYDAEGNRIRRTAIGTGAVTDYTWDHRNRLTEVVERAGVGQPATQRVTYAYDPYNRLVTRTVDADGDGPAAATVANYIHDGNQIVLEFDGSEAADLAHRYLWGPAVDQILADEQVASPGTPGGVLWPLADNLGTVRDLAQYDSQTDATTVANHRVYDAFGELQSETNPAVDHLFAYTARLFDDAAGLQWNLNRWYDPAVGRWLSADPIGFEAGDANLYRYVGNGPAAWTDPTGLASQDPLDPPEGPGSSMGSGPFEDVNPDIQFDEMKEHLDKLEETARDFVKEIAKELGIYLIPSLEAYVTKDETDSPPRDPDYTIDTGQVLITGMHDFNIDWKNLRLAYTTVGEAQGAFYLPGFGYDLSFEFAPLKPPDYGEMIQLPALKAVLGNPKAAAEELWRQVEEMPERFDDFIESAEEMRDKVRWGFGLEINW